MSESYAEQLSRVRLMASGSDTWDLSDKDTAALTAVLEQLEASGMEVAVLQAREVEAVKLARDLIEPELRKDKARLDWLERVGFACSNSGTTESPRVHCWGGCSPLRWTATYISSEFTNARDAIDAAMEASK